jgi:hypothetical protein
MRFDPSNRVQKYGVLCGVLMVFALAVSYATANRAGSPEPKKAEVPGIARVMSSATADQADDHDDFSERWTAIKSEAYRAAVVAKSRLNETMAALPAPSSSPAPVPSASPSASPSPAASPSPVPSLPMAQATEDDLKQYREERKARAEARPHDDICKKGRYYFYREHHQYWRCKR